MKLNVEKIQAHEVQDIWRIKDGLLLYVNKYKKHPKYDVGYITTLDSKNSKIIQGCKGLRKLKEDYTNHYSSIYVPKDTYIFENRPIEISTNPNEFHFDIRSSGGSIYGNYETTKAVLNEIQKIMDNYY